MSLEFRLLRADEIDARVGMSNDKGITLLLYKDARCDQNILDETVGPFNWQRHHSRDNANCTVAIWDETKCQWIEKEDTGTESNMEKEKGLASDSFKRACFNWGIGRELYTGPLMWVSASELKNGNKDRFKVTGITYEGRSIASVTVVNLSTKNIYTFGNPPKSVANTTIDALKYNALVDQCTRDGVNMQLLCNIYGVDSLKRLNEMQHSNIIQHWDQVKEKCRQ